MIGTAFSVLIRLELAAPGVVTPLLFIFLILNYNTFWYKEIKIFNNFAIALFLLIQNIILFKITTTLLKNKQPKCTGNTLLWNNLSNSGIFFTFKGLLLSFSRKITLSKQLKNIKGIKNFSTATHLNNNPKLDPYFVTGLIDGEGSFIVSICKRKNYKFGWQVHHIFKISLHSRDISLILQLQQFFGGIGSVYKDKAKNIVSYSVTSFNDLTKIIIPHFVKFPLISKKAADFILFQQIIELMNNKEHLTVDGLHKIINIRASINLGLSELQKSEFNNLKPVERPIINTTKIPHPQWVAGFACAEGCFYVLTSKSKTKIGQRVQLGFKLSQHERDIKLMELLVDFFGSGQIYKGSKKSVVSLTIVKISDITNIIIPLFENHPLVGVKQLDFIDFCKVENLINEGGEAAYKWRFRFDHTN